MTRITAHELINDVLDPGTFRSWDTPPEYGVISSEYEDALARARERSGVDEAVVTGDLTHFIESGAGQI